MDFDAQTMLVGAVSGIATIVLCLGVATGSSLALLLFVFSPLPIMVAGLGWGASAGVVGLLISSVGVAIIANPETAGFVLLTTSLPSAMAALWLTLARPASEMGGPNDKVAWFPLSQIIFRLAVMTAVAFIAAGLIAGYGRDFAVLIADQMVERLQEQNAEFGFSPDAREAFVQNILVAVPLLQPAFWLFLLVMNLYIAIWLSKQSGRLARPQDLWPLAMRMPRNALFALAGAVLLTFVGGNIALAASCLIGALLAGFTLSGYAVFHHRTVGQPWRPLAMIIAYGSTVIFLFPALFFTGVGLFNPANNMPVSPSGGSGTPPPIT
ncbi:MAG: DUF2232 domain-containing protein [Pseudomonadota bacterium]